MVDILDRLKSSIGKGATVVSVRSKEAIAATRASGQIERLETRRRAAIEELGNTAYAMLKGGFQETELRAKAEAIAEIDAEIGMKREELEQIHTDAAKALGKDIPLGQCACGGPIFEGSKFCGKCGSPVDPKTEPDPETAPTACRCGAMLVTGASFCGSCGQPVTPAIPSSLP